MHARNLTSTPFNSSVLPSFALPNFPNPRPPQPQYLHENERVYGAFFKTAELDLTDQIELDGNSYVVTTLDWIAGSSLGTMTIVDLDGSVYEPGTPEYEVGGLRPLHHATTRHHSMPLLLTPPHSTL